jgi:hypothetical protein
MIFCHRKIEHARIRETAGVVRAIVSPLSAKMHGSQMEINQVEINQVKTSRVQVSPATVHPMHLRLAMSRVTRSGVKVNRTAGSPLVAAAASLKRAINAVPRASRVPRKRHKAAVLVAIHRAAPA